MSITLSLEFDGGVDCPFWFEHSDSKCLVDFCSEIDRGLLEGGDASAMERLERRLSLRLDPLRKLAEDDMDPEEFLDFAEDERQANELWRKHQAQNQDAWQSVSALAAFLRTLAAAFEQRPDLLADIQVRESPWRYLPEYYGGSGLRNDLRDLLRMVEWGEQQGLKRVRLMLM